MKIAIIGRGLLGSLVAFYLAKSEQHTLTLFDQNPARSAALTAAGLLAPITELDKSPRLVAEVGLASFLLWPLLIQEVDPTLYYKRQGSIVIAHPQDKALLSAYLTKINTLIPNESCLSLNRDALSRLEPALSGHQQGLYISAEGQLDNQTFLAKLAQILRKMNVTFRDNVQVSISNPPALAVGNTQQHFDLVIDCRGMGAAEIFSNLRAVRGELIWLSAKEVFLSRPVRLLHPRYSIYIAPRPNYHYIIGATEIESHDLSEISVRSTLELLSAAYTVHKGFHEARIIHTATNLRPTLPDGLPRIITQDGLIAVNGMYRHGFLLAPVLARQIAQFIETGEPEQQFSEFWSSNATNNI